MGVNMDVSSKWLKSIIVLSSLILFSGVATADSSEILSKETIKKMDQSHVDKDTDSMALVENWVPGSTGFMFPGEPLPKDQIRVTIMGSGWGYYRPGQVGASIYVELGNGDNFIFDLGAGSSGKYKVMQIPYSKMTNIFLTHLHLDHLGDVPDLWTFGPSTDRFKPINIYGPSGDTPELGTKYAIENMKKYANWNLVSFKTALPESKGFDINVYEFDYQKNPGIVYDKNGVLIKSFPAVHTINGAVSYRLEWNGMSVVISGDTNPSMFMVENAKGADIIFHETAPLPETFTNKMGYPEEVSKRIVDSSHTPPQALGKIFALTKPRMGVITHTLRNKDTVIPVTDLVRIHYKGPLVFGDDLMVFNISKTRILQRMAIGPKNPWMYLKDTQPNTKPALKASDYKSKSLLDKVIPACDSNKANSKSLCY